MAPAVRGLFLWPLSLLREVLGDALGPYATFSSLSFSIRSISIADAPTPPGTPPQRGYAPLPGTKQMILYRPDHFLFSISGLYQTTGFGKRIALVDKDCLGRDRRPDLVDRDPIFVVSDLKFGPVPVRIGAARFPGRRYPRFEPLADRGRNVLKFCPVHCARAYERRKRRCCHRSGRCNVPNCRHSYSALIINERLPLQSSSGNLVPGRNRCGLREFKLTAKYAPAANLRIYFLPSGDISPGQCVVDKRRAYEPAMPRGEWRCQAVSGSVRLPAVPRALL